MVSRSFLNRSVVLTVFALTFSIFLTAQQSFAQTVVNITVDENGDATVQFPPALPNFLPGAGVMSPDPGPGGLTSALTYDVGTAVVAGDLFLYEPGSLSTISDVIRFNPLGTGGQGINSMVFYSDAADIGEAVSLADTGFPAAIYTNTFSVNEVLIGNMEVATYTPLVGQPGYLPGFTANYTFNSSVVPEPTSIALISICMAVAGTSRFARRRRAA